MTASSSPGFSYRFHKFKDVVRIRGFQTHFILFCFSRGTICKMKVYVGSLYKIETESCSGKSGSSKILALLPLLGSPGLQVNGYFGGNSFL